MFDSVDVAASPDGRVDAAVLQRWARLLGGVDRNADDAARIDQIRALEELKSAAAAAQAKLSADFAASQRREQAEQEVPARRRGRGIAAQVALARRESPHRGTIHLGLAEILVGEMPHTLAALASGHLDEWKATLLVRETGWLSLADRQTVDRAIAGDTDTLDELGARQLINQARTLAYRLDPASVVNRARRAESQRRVTTRPAPDTMAYLTALLPVAQAVAAQAALSRAADAAHAAGDPRSRSQLMADLLVERLTGQATATGVPVTVHLVMTLETLCGGPEPAHLHGHGIIPGRHARALLTHASTTDQAWLRRLYTTPDGSELVAADSRARCFPHGLAQLIALRDQVCRTPFCDAPIRHRDHIIPAAAGGPTTRNNGQGLCQACNHAKQAPGWHARPRPGPRHRVHTTTPTGHDYASHAPPPPGTPPTHPAPVSRLEAHFTDYVLAS